MDLSKPDKKAMVRTFAGDIKAVRGETANDNKVVLPVGNESNSTEVSKPKNDTSSETTDAPSNKENFTRPYQRQTSTRSAEDYLSSDSLNDVSQIKSDQTTGPKKINIPTQTLISEVEQIPVFSRTEILGDEDTYDVDSDTGTIIQDKKIQRHRLLPSIFRATKDWAGDTKADIEEAQKAKLTMAKPETRANIINEAAEQSKRVPQADYDDVAEKLKLVERGQDSPTIVITDKEDIPEPKWSYTIGEQDITTEEPASKPTTLANSNVTQKENLPPSEPKVATIPVTEEVEQAIADNTNQVEQEIDALTETTLSDITEDVPEKAYTITWRDRLGIIKSSISNIPIYSVVIVFILICIIGITSSLLILVNRNQEKLTAEVPAKERTYTEPTTAVNFSTNQKELVFSIAAARQNNGQLHIIQFKNQAGEMVPSLNAGQIILDKENTDLLNRSLKETTFGFTDTNKPFILLNTANFDSAFAGMLAWEKTISNDLSPLFGNSNKNSFVDIMYNQQAVKSARALYDEKGQAQIIYTVSKNGRINIVTDVAELPKLDKLTKK